MTEWRNLQASSRIDVDRVTAALIKYPEAYRTEVFGRFHEVMPIEKAVEVVAPTFNAVTKSYGKDATKFWLRYQIANTFAVIGVYDQVDAAQVRAIADDILNDEIYGQFTLPEFLSFLARFRMGKYGKIYSTNKPNMQEFMMALQPFWKDLQIERGRARMKKEHEEREREWAEQANARPTIEIYNEMKANGLLKNI